MIKFTNPERISGLDGLTYEHRYADKFSLSGSRKGLHITGEIMIESNADLERLAQEIGEAWSFHERVLKDALVIAPDLTQLNLPGVK